MAAEQPGPESVLPQDASTVGGGSACYGTNLLSMWLDHNMNACQGQIRQLLLPEFVLSRVQALLCSRGLWPAVYHAPTVVSLLAQTRVDGTELPLTHLSEPEDGEAGWCDRSPG